MSDPVFHAQLPDPLPPPGGTVVLDGPEGRHAAVVRRIRTGETVVLTDGMGRAVSGRVVAVEKQSLTVEVAERMVQDAPAVRLVVAQALAVWMAAAACPDEARIAQGLTRAAPSEVRERYRWSVSVAGDQMKLSLFDVRGGLVRERSVISSAKCT